ncbi:MAG: hypothetical protein Kow00121_12830 [Elainellaceae cyanobacterium]
MLTPGIEQTLQAIFFRRQNSQLSSSKPSEQGLGLIEALMAVVVMGLTIGLVLPPLFIAAATRVQTRRAEQALQIAQGEVDRVRVLVARGQHTPTGNWRLPATITGNNINAQNPPTTATTLLRSPRAACNTYDGRQISITQALMIDIDGDPSCTPDFMMQVFRTSGSTTRTEQLGQGRPSDFELGVRVYSTTAGRAANQGAVTPGSTLTGILPGQASLSLTSGEGNQLKRALAIVNTRVTWGDRDSSLCGYQGSRQSQIESCLDTF